MKRGRRVLLILVACGVALAAVFFWRREREPEYNGKRLREWLHAYGLGYTNDAQRKTFISQQEASDAIRHMGTNAAPWLVRWIAYEPPEWKKRVRAVVRKLPIDVIQRKLWEDNKLAMDALGGFSILGSEASPVVPELAGLLNDSRRRESLLRAMRALVYIGSEGLPPLVRVIEGQPIGRFYATRCILAMYESGIDIRPAVPALLLQERKRKRAGAGPRMEMDVADWVPVLAEKPGFFVSALTNCLTHSNSDVRLEAAHDLGDLRAEALLAVPSLVSALNEPVFLVREAATNALRKIAPKVLEKDGQP